MPKEELKFGKTFSDHMLEMDWTVQDGWAAPRIGPYGPFAIDPSASVLHYGLECFEGMKAYMDKDGNTRMFRPDMNMARLNRSMGRFGFPVSSVALCLASFASPGSPCRPCMHWQSHSVCGSSPCPAGR